MQVLYDGLDGKQCAIIFTENGLSSIRFSNGEVRHRVPPTRLRTEVEQEEWLTTHPKAKPYLHEVLAAVAAARKNPRVSDETDSEWMALLRLHSSLRAEVVYKDVERFTEQYEVATGESLNPWKRPGIHIHRPGANKWGNTLYLLFGQPLLWCPVEVHREPEGGFAIRNTGFIWSLIARDGFRLDP